MPMLRPSFRRKAALVALLATWAVAPALAQSPPPSPPSGVPTGSAAPAPGGEFGRYEYETYCAVCHGTDGKGNGPFTMLLNKRVPDLSVLAKNNRGIFPFARAYDVVVGTADVGAHGSREMPIWGDVFIGRAQSVYGPNYRESTGDAYVKARVLALVEYISRLQE
jgi:mono/diheme cytochrome c family protein